MNEQKQMSLKIPAQTRIDTQTVRPGAQILYGMGVERQMIRWGLLTTLAVVVFSLFFNQLVAHAQDQPVSPLAAETMALPAQRHSIFIPLVTNDTGGVVASGCSLNDNESVIMDMMRKSSRQKRAALVCNPILAKVARERAADMAARDYFSHVNPDGEGPNYLVTEAGFRLPNWYSDAKNANNLESIAAGYKSATDTWDAWMQSPSHEKHVLGLDEFYAAQTEVGIGYVSLPESKYKHYWVVISAPRE